MEYDRATMMLAGLLLATTVALPPPELPADEGMCVLGDSCERHVPERAPDQTAPQSPMEPAPAMHGGEGAGWRRTDFADDGSPLPAHRASLDRPPRS